MRVAHSVEPEELSEDNLKELDELRIELGLVPSKDDDSVFEAPPPPVRTFTHAAAEALQAHFGYAWRRGRR